MTTTLYIDFDGTLTEWNANATLQDLEQAEFFYHGIPQENILACIRAALSEGYDVKILSCVTSKDAEEQKKLFISDFLPELYHEDSLTDSFVARYTANHPLPIPGSAQEVEWDMQCQKALQRYLEPIAQEIFVFVPDGEKDKKFDYIKTNDDDHINILLDDHTPNLVAFEAHGGYGIKVMNNVNGQNGTWRGDVIFADDIHAPEAFLQYIKEIEFRVQENAHER